MNLFRNICKLMLVSVAFVLVTSCGQSSDESNSPAIQTIEWQLDGKGFVQFLTNDPQYYNYSFWSIYNQSNESPMSTVAATVKKESGHVGSGYGIIFCYQDNNNFYRLLIDAKGDYNVYSKVGGTYSAIIPWTTGSAHLSTGFGVENNISVTQQSPNNFSIDFNGTQETTFSDGNFSGGKAGFFAYVAKQTEENFPNTPQDDRFKLTSPVVYP